FVRPCKHGTQRCREVCVKAIEMAEISGEPSSSSNSGSLHLQGFLHGRGGFRTCDLSRVKHDEFSANIAYLQGKSTARQGAGDGKHPEPAGFCREFGTTLSQTRRRRVRRCFRPLGRPDLALGAAELVGGLDLALCDRCAPMSVARAPELLIELLTE